MKRIYLGCLVLLITGFSMTSCDTGRPSIDADLSEKELQSNITSGKYIFYADYAYPRTGVALDNVLNNYINAYGGSSSQLNIAGEGYFFRIYGDSAEAHLPFYGERYSNSGYRDEQGIQFKKEFSKYKFIPGNSRRAKKGFLGTLQLETSDKMNEVYKISLDVFRNGKADLRIISNQRSPIYYRGHLSPRE